VRILFCEIVLRGFSGITETSKYLLNVATSELIHNKLGSSTGTNEALFSTLCPFSLKISRNIERISELVNFFIFFLLNLFHLFFKNKKRVISLRQGRLYAVPP